MLKAAHDLHDKLIAQQTRRALHSSNDDDDDEVDQITDNDIIKTVFGARTLQGIKFSNQRKKARKK